MPSRKNSRKRKGKGVLGVEQEGQLDDVDKGAVAIRPSKRQKKKATATSPATLSLSNHSTSCSWSAFKACSPLLLAPLTCSITGCSAAVHEICQAICENKNGF